MESDLPLLEWVPRAVVFDCDGLLMDTEPCWTVAETELFAGRGLAFGPEQKALLIGRSLRAGADLMADLFGEPGTGDAIAEELLAAVAEIVSTRAEAMFGAHRLVEMVARAVPVAVASNSPRVLLDAALLRGGFTGVFPVSVAADEVEQPKPAPDIYNRACEMLGAVAEQTLAFEDSMTGLRSARAAGVRLVGVPTLRHDPFPADLVVESLADGHLLAWIQRWPVRPRDP